MNNVLVFDELGLLKPSDKILTNLQAFERTFVTNFPYSKTRKRLFEHYLIYIEHFSKGITPQFTHWINGSFVTLKENPNDIDFVVFIASDVFESKQGLLEGFWSFSLEDEGLDAYIVKVYPSNNAFYSSVTQLFSDEWRKRFTHTKANKVGQIYRKGFVEIEF